ncbi:hypothetical protein B0H10DRAFT_1397623 [Mycena sp. CBHHK59/15]|nr:hypothetical protein B0H10DRAFT_1397623 [Mycena sp. CBHHK59/15]
MADETELLDWDEDDNQPPFVAAEPDEDAVSLGASDDEAEETTSAAGDADIPPPSTKASAADTMPSKRHSPSRHEYSSSRGRGDRDRERDRERHRERDDRERDNHRERRPPRITVAPPPTHALPPKPVTTVPAFMHPSHPSSIEATLMAPSTVKDGKDTKPKSSTAPNDGKTKTSTASNGSNAPGHHSLNSKSGSSDRDRDQALPEEWEVRQSRTGGSTSSHFYYNKLTYKSTWERPRTGTGVGVI